MPLVAEEKWVLERNQFQRMPSYNVGYESFEFSLNTVAQPAEPDPLHENAFIMAGTVVSFPVTDDVKHIEYIELDAGARTYLIWSARVNATNLLVIDIYPSGTEGASTRLDQSSSCVFRDWNYQSNVLEGINTKFVPNQNVLESFRRQWVGDCRLTRLQ
jgi:hypothetical protein